MRVLLCSFILVFASCVRAQIPPESRMENTPNATINAVFDAMKAGDTTGLRAYFHPDATLHSVVTKPTGETVVSAATIGRWFKGIQKAAPGDWEEELHYTEVNIDGHLASAWSPYVFNYKGELHHCGTNTFQLVKDGDAGQWRILHISDTRRDAAGDCTTLSKQTPREAIEALATGWHKAAADADSTVFFDSMADDAIYIGTDKTEHWTKTEFLGFAAPYFARGIGLMNAVGGHQPYATLRLPCVAPPLQEATPLETLPFRHVPPTTEISDRHPLSLPSGR